MKGAMRPIRALVAAAVAARLARECASAFSVLQQGAGPARDFTGATRGGAGRAASTLRGATSELSELDPQKAVVKKLDSAAEFVTPAVWNKPSVRGLALVLGGAAVGRVMPFEGMLHTTAYGIWLGTNVWTTFVAGLTMFKNLPRQQFGTLQSKLFPKYFQLGTLCTALMLLTGWRLGLPTGPLIVSLLFTLANLLYLEPENTRVMFQRYDNENKGVKDVALNKKLKAEFNKLHGLSSLANLLALVALITHGAYLSARL